MRTDGGIVSGFLSWVWKPETRVGRFGQNRKFKGKPHTFWKSVWKRRPPFRSLLFPTLRARGPPMRWRHLRLLHAPGPRANHNFQRSMKRPENPVSNLGFDLVGPIPGQMVKKHSTSLGRSCPARWQTMTFGWRSRSARGHRGKICGWLLANDGEGQLGLAVATLAWRW